MFGDFLKKNKGQLTKIIDDRIFGFHRNRKSSEQRKGAKITADGEGEPLDGEGANGDITIRRTPQGIILYAKYNGSWYGTELHKMNKQFLGRLGKGMGGIGKAMKHKSSNEDLREALNKVIEKVNK